MTVFRGSCGCQTLSCLLFMLTDIFIVFNSLVSSWSVSSEKNKQKKTEQNSGTEAAITHRKEKFKEYKELMAA